MKETIIMRESLSSDQHALPVFASASPSSPTNEMGTNYPTVSSSSPIGSAFAAGPSSPVSVIIDAAAPPSELPPTKRLEPLPILSTTIIGNKRNVAVDDDDNSVKADHDAGVSQHRISLDYMQFPDADSTQQQQQERHKVTKSIFMPLYVATALLIFLPVLPSFLVILLGTAWGILFLVTPVYFLYHYDPLVDMPSGSKC